jgi:hypothetical protein
LARQPKNKVQVWIIELLCVVFQNSITCSNINVTL